MAKRIALTIVLNGEHHLLNWGEENCKNFDYWIIAEGAVNPINCTSWCNPIPQEYLSNECHSRDNTLKVIEQLNNKYHNIILITKDTFWDGKIEMFDAMTNAIEDNNLKNIDYLWQVDCDEYWCKEDLESAEKRLSKSNAICSRFLTDTILTANDTHMLQVFGQWGEGKDNNFKRLWKYEPGSYFVSHEPTQMSHECNIELGWQENPERPLHLSYFYEKDVFFKSRFYKNHESCFDGWKKLREMIDTNMPMLNGSALFLAKGIGKYMNRTFIKKVPISDTLKRIKHDIA